MKFAWILIFSTLSFAGTHAPLPPSLASAKTAYIDNQSGNAEIADRCYDELNKWGRFTIVNDPKQADVIFQIEAHKEHAGYRGSIGEPGDPSNVDLRARSVGYTTIAVVDREHHVLWSDTKSSVRPFRTPRPAADKIIKELRKRMEEQ